MHAYLKMSSLHLTQEDANLLDGYEFNAPIIVKDVEDGFTVGVPGFTGRREITEMRLEALRAAGHSEGFVEIVRWAGDRKAWQIRFDESGQVHPDFPVGGYVPAAGLSPR